MSQVKKLQNGGKTQETTKKYGHLIVDGIDYGNSEELYNAFAGHAHAQDLNQGQFYDQWLAALKNGEDVVFGNGNTVNLKPVDMSEARAGKRNNWRRFWDDTFDTERNHFSDAIYTARGFTFNPKPEEKKPEPTKKDFDLSKLVLDYNDSPDKKGHKIWSVGSATNQRAKQRVTDAIAIMLNPENSEYNELPDDVKAAYAIASANGVDPNEFANQLWERLQDNSWTGYKNPDSDNDLDWLKAFNITITPYTQTSGTSSSAQAPSVISGTPTSGSQDGNPSSSNGDGSGTNVEGGVENQPEIQTPINPLYNFVQQVGSPQTFTFIPDGQPTFQYNTNRNVATGVPEHQSPTEKTDLSNKMLGIKLGDLTYNKKNFQIVQDTDGKYFALENNGPRYLLDSDFITNWVNQNLSNNDFSKLNHITESGKDYLKRLWKFDIKSPNFLFSDQWFKNTFDLIFNPSEEEKQLRRDRVLVYENAKKSSSSWKEAHEKRKNELDELRKGTQVEKGQNGLQFKTPRTFGQIINDSLFETQQPDYQLLGGIGAYKNPTAVEKYSGTTPVATNFKVPESKPVQPTYTNSFGDPNMDSHKYWDMGIRSGLAALDYGSMAWGRRKVHDQIEKGLKDSLYKHVTPQLAGVSTATPIEDAAIRRYDEYVGRGLTTPLTSDNVANTQNVLTLQANALAQRDQAVRQQSAAALNREMQNQQIHNKQLELDANAENDFRARLAGLKLNLSQNDASLTTQTAQSIQNIAREWRTNYDEQLKRYNQLAYNTDITNATKMADNRWLGLVRTNHSDAWNAWNSLSTVDKNKYGNDFTTWAQQSSYWPSMESDYIANRDALRKTTLNAYKNYNLLPELKWMFRDRYAIPSSKKGGTLNGKTRYKHEPDEEIWINQNKSAHRAVAKFNDNIIKTFLKTLK